MTEKKEGEGGGGGGGGGQALLYFVDHVIKLRRNKSWTLTVNY